MEHALAGIGLQVRVIEDCLNGRRTAWDDPFKAGRNGLAGVEQRLEINSPLALVIVLLRYERLSVRTPEQRLAVSAGTGRGDSRHEAGADRARYADTADPRRGAAADQNTARRPADLGEVRRGPGTIAGRRRRLQGCGCGARMRVLRCRESGVDQRDRRRAPRRRSAQTSWQRSRQGCHGNTSGR